MSTSSKIKVTIDGVEMSGNPDELAQLLTKLGIDDRALYYNSSSKGKLLISEMHTEHLRNAILRMYSDWVANLQRTVRSMDDAEFLTVLKNGAGEGNITLLAMVNELHKRVADNEGFPFTS